MFDDDAPIWRFLDRVPGDLDPFAAVSSAAGRFVLEVFPALGNLGLFPGFYERGAMPKYNPENATFSRDDWRLLCQEVASQLGALGVAQGAVWCERAGRLVPRKAEQDQLDAIICALHAFRWRAFGLWHSAVIGDLNFGYILVPVHPRLAAELRTDARRHAVAFAPDHGVPA